MSEAPIGPHTALLLLMLMSAVLEMAVVVVVVVVVLVVFFCWLKLAMVLLLKMEPLAVVLVAFVGMLLGVMGLLK